MTNRRGRPAPPRLALRLLQAVLPATESEAFIGDLLERFEERTASTTAALAPRLWFWLETFAALALVRPARHARPVAFPHGDPRMLSFLADLRHGARLLRRAPGFTALCVLTIALGVGVTTAIFSVANPVILRALPYPESERLAAVWERYTDGSPINTTFATFTDLMRESRSLERAAAIGGWQPTLAPNGGEAERVIGQRVSSSFFGVLGVRPALGRDFLPADDDPAAERVAILSHGLWVRRFGGDSGIVGRPIPLNGDPHIVVGVLPASFDNVIEPESQVWRPLRYIPSQPWACRTCRHLRVIARVRDGVPLATAAAELDAISARLVAAHPTEYAATGMHLVPLQQQVTQAVRPVLLTLLGASALVLLIAVANVASLQLARAMGREDEFAVRMAIGAGRGRLTQQLLAEGLLLAVLGGFVGLLAAWLALPALLAQLPESLPRLSTIGLDPAVLGVTAGITLMVGVIAGLAPAWQGERSAFETLRGGTRLTGAGRRTARAGLVVSEIALAVMLLVGAGLLARSFVRLLSVNAGFDPSHLLALEVQATGAAYETDRAVHANRERMRELVREIPGVVSVGTASQLPLAGQRDQYGVRAQDRPLANPALAPSADRYVVSPDFMRTIGVPVIRGRAFDPADSRDSVEPVAIVSAALAAKIWPGEDALGKRIQLGSSESPWRTVVGIAGNVRHEGLDAAETQQVYIPERQWPWADAYAYLVARTRGDPATLAAAVREAVRSVDPAQPIARVATMDQIVATSTAQRRLALLLFGAFAGTALLLAAAGIYGVLAGSVAERTREIGLRAALGATPADLLRLVLRQGLVLVAAGIVVGTTGALWLGGYLERLLFGIRPTDPLTIGGVAVLLACVALVACLVPARHAIRVDPMAALRDE